jgi:hypothetical protein
VSCCIVKSTAHPMACLSCRNRFSRWVAIDRSYRTESRPGGLWFVLVLQICSPPPAGQLCGRGWSQLGGGHSGDAPLWRGFFGGTAPPLVS